MVTKASFASLGALTSTWTLLLGIALVTTVNIPAAYCKAMDNVVRGRQAIEHLGSKIPELARFYGFNSESELRDLLLQDGDLGVDVVNNDGSLLMFACTGIEVYFTSGYGHHRHLLIDQDGAPSGNMSNTSMATPDDDVYANRRQPHSHSHAHLHRKLGATSSAGHHAGFNPTTNNTKPKVNTKQHSHHEHNHTERHAGPKRKLTQDLPAYLADPKPNSIPHTSTGLPLLHSRFSSTRKIFLDFDGHITTNTAWNSLAQSPTITTPPFSKDADISRFSIDEQADIIAIWRAVSEDFAAFDVDVTTEDPGPEGLKLTTGSDTAYGIRVCIGGSSFDWYGQGAAGAAYISSFSWDSDTPAYVFPAQLGPNGAKFIWEAISHEVGHTLSLYHDGSSGNMYYKGHGDWAPIMGSAHFKQITQFSRGEYANANNQQDDFAVMNGYLPPAPDSHADTLNKATPITSKATTSGFIGFDESDDYFYISADPGPINIVVSIVGPYGSYSRSNLDVMLTLSDAWGQVIASSNPVAEGSPATALPASLATKVGSAGIYYVCVRKTGYGDPATNGYSSYGSNGQYSVTATFTQSATVIKPSIAVMPASAAPAAPVVTAIKANKPRRMVVTFEDRSTGENSFQVQRCSGPGCSNFNTAVVVFSTSSGSAGSSYSATDLAPTTGVVYSYRVVACASGTCSSPSNVLVATAL